MNSRSPSRRGVESSAAKVAEPDASETEARYRHILDSVTDIIQCFDVQGNILYTSPSFTRRLGRTPGELRHMRAMELIHPEDRHHVKDAFKKLGSSDSVVVRYRSLPADGTIMWSEATMRALRRESDGRIAEIVVVSRDITDQVRAESALRESEQELRRVLENISDIVSTLDGDMVRRYVSPSVKDVLGFEPAELIGSAVDTEMLHPEDRDAVMQTLEKLRTLRSHDHIETFQNRLVGMKGGETVWLETRARPTRWNADGSVSEFLFVSRDITKRKEIEAALEAALRQAEAASAAKSRFLANMSHELRTPLNAILGFSDVIRQEVFGSVTPGRYKTYAEMIHESGSHLLDLINDVLDMSKIEAGKWDLRLENVDMSELVGACCKLVDMRARDAELMLRTEIEPGLPPLHVDRRAIFQVILNLLTNAIKFTFPGGLITLSVKRSGSTGVTLEVQDTGIGIPPEDLARLTEPFEQGRQNPHLAYGGTGLGLALVRTLATMHHGSLKIDSQPGEGTTVTVSLPYAMSSSSVTAA